jgi:hypothetical protein
VYRYGVERITIERAVVCMALFLHKPQRQQSNPNGRGSPGLDRKATMLKT